MINTIFFDLDGTLLPMDQEQFTKAYFSELTRAMESIRDPHELVRVIWKGTEAMIANNGSCSNEEVFWKLYQGIYGMSARQDESAFLDFYERKFDSLKAVCCPEPIIADVVDILLKKGYSLVVASNPLFPMVAQRKRIEWAGLNPDNFSYITSYENSSFCKPNPAYYQEILNTIAVDAENCLMIGNDVHEDMSAAALGIDVFLITDCMINKHSTDISSFSSGGYSDLLRYVRKLPTLK